MRPSFRDNLPAHVVTRLAMGSRAPQLITAGMMAGLSLAYLLIFVARGWVPHDEGMIGQSAERVLAGAVPHVDYQEPYTGGLAWLHAAVFGFAGMDLLYPRWLLFAGAALAQALTYLILRRFLAPMGAALGTWVALGWSFPNYFAALPSWWVLICGLACLWAFIRHVETGFLRYAVAAGLAAGVSILIKQTGLYVLMALIMALLYGGGWGERETTARWPGRIPGASVAVAAVALAFTIIGARLALADLLYLFLPIVACSWILLTADGRQAYLPPGQRYPALMAALGAAAAPLMLFVAPYLVDGQFGALIDGLFVLPQKRMQFASVDMPPPYWIFAGVPLVAMVLPLQKLGRAAALLTHQTGLALWLLGALLLTMSLYAVTPYQIIWQSARGFAALLPVATAWIFLSGRVCEVKERAILVGCITMLAWASLVQFPFGAPIYFCYVAPLVVIAASAVAGTSGALRRPVVLVSATVLLMFAIASMNRGYIHNLGRHHFASALNVALDLDRAHLTVSAADAVTYRRVAELVADHIGNGTLVAGPDCPEVYYLAGQFSAAGTLFDFFDDDGSVESGLSDLSGWQTASVIVLNHRPSFSEGLAAEFAARIRTAFPNAAVAGNFEVRWR